MDVRKAIALAMKGEIEGRELYKMAASNADDGKAREIFSKLAEEENLHFEWLKGIYDSVVDSEVFEMPVMEKLVKFQDASNPIFSREFKKRIGESHFEMSALSIALKLELDAFQFYAKMSAESPDGRLKEFFARLSEWEKGHYRALNQEIEFFQDEYFQQNKFSPF